MRIIAGLGLLSIVWGCCHYPKGRVTRMAGISAPPGTITVVAYGDTRTGPWGLGDNASQAVHGKVVDDILKNDGPIDAVIFTGDAVMTNFPLWRKDYWRCFLSQSNRFQTAGIPFYPSLGNHEVLIPIVPLMKTTAAPGTSGPMAAGQDQAAQVAAAYEAGEQAAAAKQPPGPEAVVETVEPSTKQGRALLKEWERGIGKGDVASAHKFGQFEGHLQKSFYAVPPDRDERCESDAKTFSDNYLAQAKYEYLRPLLHKRSYYSTTLENGGLHLKLIALDTNCLDSRRQQDFLASELEGFKGPIIVFGHHPPVDYEQPGASWDLVPGWGKKDDEEMKRYLSHPEGKNVALWIFGHVHNYQRRGPSGTDQQAAAPVVLVAGGGGASPLDQGPAGFQWQPSAWPAPFSKSAYSQVRLTVTTTSIAVEVRGADDKASDFKVVDSFSIPLATSASK
jgi:Calcineurin-like phosphoesterase